MRTVKFDADVMAAMKARAEKAERERDAFAKLAHTYTDENNEHMRRIATLEHERDEAVDAKHEWSEVAKENASLVDHLIEERDEAREERRRAERLAERYHVTIKHIEALVERWRKECPETPGWADELLAVLKEEK